jgi:hypothetical protein
MLEDQMDHHVPLQKDLSQVQLTAHIPSAQNSVVRRRRVPQQATTTPEQVEAHSYPPHWGGSADQEDDPYKKHRRPVLGKHLRRSIHHLSTIIAPSWVYHKTAPWGPERLERRLATLRGWVWGVTAALATYVIHYYEV